MTRCSYQCDMVTRWRRTSCRFRSAPLATGAPSPNGASQSRRRLLKEAAQKIGGSELLAKHLGISTFNLQQWMNGKDVPPAQIFHKALDLLLNDKP